MDNWQLSPFKKIFFNFLWLDILWFYDLIFLNIFRHYHCGTGEREKPESRTYNIRYHSDLSMNLTSEYTDMVLFKTLLS